VSSDVRSVAALPWAGAYFVIGAPGRHRTCPRALRRRGAVHRRGLGTKVNLCL